MPESPTYPGSKVYSLVLAYTRLQAQHTALTTSSARQTWINPWQIEKGFLNPLQVKVTLRELIKLGEQLRELAVLLGRSGLVLLDRPVLPACWCMLIYDDVF